MGREGAGRVGVLGYGPLRHVTDHLYGMTDLVLAMQPHTIKIEFPRKTDLKNRIRRTMGMFPLKDVIVDDHLVRVG